MKRYLILTAAVFFVIFSFGQQGFGFGVGFSTSKAPMVNVKYFFDRNAVSLGGSYQAFNDALGKKLDEPKPGASVIGDGDYFYSVDIGYTRILNEKFSLSGEVSIAKKIFYQNFTDYSFSQGGYHHTYKTISETGIGVFGTYYFNDVLGVFAGYNTKRQAFIGLDVRFLQ
ncbi:MAG TPA: hypothetical protein VGG71_03945 [Chitinophagaceae bacterium]